MAGSRMIGVAGGRAASVPLSRQRLTWFDACLNTKSGP
jgi:hypothetical protein